MIIYTVLVTIQKYFDGAYNDDVNGLASFLSWEEANAYVDNTSKKWHEEFAKNNVYESWKNKRTEYVKEMLNKHFPIREAPKKPTLKTVPQLDFSKIPVERHKPLLQSISFKNKQNQDLIDQYERDCDAYANYLKNIDMKKKFKDEFEANNPAPEKGIGAEEIPEYKIVETVLHGT